MKPKEKDKVLLAIQNETFEYKEGVHGVIISELEDYGYIDIESTKDGNWFDITNKGESFLSEGGFSAMEKDKIKKRNKEYIVRIIFLIIGAVIMKIVDVLAMVL